MNKKLKAMLVTTLFISLSAVSFAGSKATFKDTNGHWAQAVIEKYASIGIIKGDNTNNFKPNQKITRAEFFSMLHKGLDIQFRYFVRPDITKIYKDTKNEDWYATIAYDLHTAGIIDDKDFLRGNDFITREEVAHYTANAYKYKHGEIEGTPAQKIKDIKKIDKKYLSDVTLMYNLKIMGGNPGGVFNPKGCTTRAEGIVAINNLLKVVGINNLQPLEITPSATLDANDLTMKIRVRNISQQDVDITHPSGYKYDFKLLDENKNIIYTWSADKMFIQMVQTTKMQRDEVIEFSEKIPYKGNEGIIDKAKYLSGYVFGTIDGKAINKDGVTIEIKK